MKDTLQLELSWSTILRIVVTIGAIWFVVQIRDILALLFIVAVLFAALNPLVDHWTKHMPRWLVVLLLFIILIFVFTTIITLLVPPFFHEGQSLMKQIGEAIGFYVPSLQDQFRSITNFNNFSESFGQLGGRIYSTTLGAFSGLVAVITTTVLTFYLLLEQHRARDYLKSHLPLEKKEVIIVILRKISDKMGAWARGQLLLGLIIGIVTFIALSILQLVFDDIRYTLTLAVWAGITELVPYIGPILGAVPAVLLALNISPVVAVIVLLVYVLIQQIESHLLVPQVMQKAVGLSPVTIIITLLIGGKLAGLIGIVLAVPAAAAISVLLQEWPRFKKVLGK